MTTIQKTKVQHSWTTKQIQEETSSSLTAFMLFASKHNSSESIRKEWAKFRAQYFRKLNVQTPLDLVRAWAEYDTNMFGSELSYYGDKKQAAVEYYQCGCWSALESMGSTKEDQDLMCGHWAQLSSLIAAEFGYTAEEKLGNGTDEPGCTIIFTAK